MKVVLDPQIFLSQKFGGISRLFVEIWKHAIATKEIKMECPLLYSENYHLNESGMSPKNIFRIFNHLHFKGTGRIKDILKASTRRKTKEKLGQGNFDVFIATYYDPYFLDDLKGKPFILTVYDMIHELFPAHFHMDKNTIPNKKLLIEKAAKIIAISAQTKKDMLNFYPHIPAEKIEIVYLSQSIIENETTVSLPDNYLLFVGNRDAYKNFKLFAETAADFLKADTSLHIVCAGGGKLSSSETEMFDKLGISDRVIQITYKDSELAAFYKNAKAFIFPSAYEGFGIPTLEAMQCGCPVILSNSSCLPEVGGDAALYFENGDTTSLSAAIRKILSDDNLRNEFIKKGYRRANEFSWEKTAEGYYKVVKELVA